MKHNIFSIQLAVILCTFAFISCRKSSNEIAPALKNEQTISNAKKNGNSIGFSIISKVSGKSLSGTFKATEAFDEAGDFSETYAFNGKFYHSDVIFTGAYGIMEFTVHGELNFNTETHGTGTLEWKLKKATGIYENLAGSGTGTVELSNWDATAGTGDDVQSWVGEITGELGTLESAPVGSRNNDVYSSDTFILLSFTSKSTKPSNTAFTNAAKYSWSVAGASNISKIELQLYGSNWATYNTTNFNTSNNAETSYSFVMDLYGCGGNKYTALARLKTTYNNGNILYSKDLNFDYTGNGKCALWP